VTVKLLMAGRVVEARLDFDEREKLILRMGFADLSPRTARQLGLIVVEVSDDEGRLLRAQGCGWLLDGQGDKT
jgi:hypothetical protein